MWFEEAEGMSFRYVPSYAHHHKAGKPKSFKTYDKAMSKAIGMCGHQKGGAMALFRPYVYEGKHPPVIAKGPDQIRLMVTRFAVNQDGNIAPEEVGHTQETRDAA